MDGKWIFGAIGVALVIFFFSRYSQFGAVISDQITVPFTYKGYSGIGYYYTCTPGNKEGCFSHYLNPTQDSIEIIHSSYGGVSVPNSNHQVKFYLSIGSTVPNFCLSASMEEGRTDCKQYAELNLCNPSNQNCIPIVTVSCNLNGCSDSSSKCYSFEFKEVGGQDYLVINDGGNSKWVESSLDTSNLQLYGVASGIVTNLASCQSSLTLKNLEAAACNTVADTDCDGCVSDSEYPSALTNWAHQTGITDTDYPAILTNWAHQTGCT